MYKLLLLGSVVITAPFFAYADEGDLLSLGEGILDLFNNYIIPLLVGLAVLFFVGNVIRYFIVESDDTEGRATARQLGLYGILALVFIVAFWGIINFVVAGFGFTAANSDCTPVPDWISETGELCSGGDDLASNSGTFGGGFGESDLASDDSSDFGGGFGDSDLGSDNSDTSSDGGGNSTTPTQPPTPDPGGQLPNVDQPAESEADYIAAQQEVASAAEDIREELNDPEGDFGQYGTILAENGIFADFADPDGSYNDLERLQAANRLLQMGEISQSEYDSLVEATNSYRLESELGSITPAEIGDINESNSAAAATIQNEKVNLVESAVADYNENPTTTNLNDGSVQALLTEEDFPIEQQRANFDALDNNQSFNGLITDEFARDYLGALNVQRVLEAENLGDLY